MSAIFPPVDSDFEPDFHLPAGIEMPPPLEPAPAQHAIERTVDREVAKLRVPPHSIEAESSVLGGLLLDNSAWDRVADKVTSTATSTASCLVCSAP